MSSLTAFEYCRGVANARSLFPPGHTGWWDAPDDIPLDNFAFIMKASFETEKFRIVVVLGFKNQAFSRVQEYYLANYYLGAINLETEKTTALRSGEVIPRGIPGLYATKTDVHVSQLLSKIKHLDKDPFGHVAILRTIGGLYNTLLDLGQDFSLAKSRDWWFATLAAESGQLAAILAECFHQPFGKSGINMVESTEAARRFGIGSTAWSLRDTFMEDPERHLKEEGPFLVHNPLMDTAASDLEFLLACEKIQALGISYHTESLNSVSMTEYVSSPGRDRLVYRQVHVRWDGHIHGLRAHRMILAGLAKDIKNCTIAILPYKHRPRIDVYFSIHGNRPGQAFVNEAGDIFTDIVLKKLPAKSSRTRRKH